MENPRSVAARLAREYRQRGDADGWFELFYQHAAADPHNIPWADLEPNPSLLEWLARNESIVTGRQALVVGCGLGDDAEALADGGHDTLAFDISATAVDWCKTRFPASKVHYQTADLFSPPVAWRRHFDFIFEAYTLQALPTELRPQAMGCLAELLAEDGVLLVVTRGREADEPLAEVPWPLARQELDAFERAGLMKISFEDYLDAESPPKRRFRAVYRR